ncbi:MAG: hypothetical protein KDA84_29515 [Planctomycetaceae bacterium]|nr:hypothetical protein [Planctomycetaceae bacterium]
MSRDHITHKVQQQSLMSGEKMEPIEEWEFQFTVTSHHQRDEHRQRAEALIENAIEWAEERNLGIGGFGLKQRREYGVTIGQFQFGLTITEAGQTISPEFARRLFEYLIVAGNDLELTVDGGWGPFR